MKPILIASAALLSTAAIALAHSGATGIVKERMDQMGMIAKSMKTIGEMIKGKTQYDPAIVEVEAAKIARHGGETLTKLFPEGSIKKPSEATPAIWTDWDRFSSIASDLSLYAAALSEGAGNDRANGAASLAGQSGDPGSLSPDELFGAVAKTCSACHEDFRQKK
ncbi:MAG: cytochrome c [Paracoccaceae bacterium]|nr:cytochrome c [Paracoccaceae bacterium]